VTSAFGDRIMARADALATCSEYNDKLCRRYLTPEHRGAIAMLTEWMEAAGMRVRVDAAGNCIGRYEATQAGAPAVMVGSHIDTVRDAGRYDGMLGILCAIECVEALHATSTRLAHALEVVAFGDEEGVRFKATLLGSSAIAGTFDPDWLQRKDDDGVTLRAALDAFGLEGNEIAEARRVAAQVSAFIEVHIEQGPVLESEDLALGVVSAIAGASRFNITVTGQAGHAGTVPMGLRQDALAASAEMVLEIERLCTEREIVGTVGQITANPGAVNVISGQCQFSLDIRASDDALRQRVAADLWSRLHKIADRRGVVVATALTHDFDACECDHDLMAQLTAALKRGGHSPKQLPSGAGHDAMAMAALTPVAMLFVRCERGISHHPDERMTAEDAESATTVLLDFLQHYQPTQP
jgi:allantoate deiminase